MNDQRLQYLLERYRNGECDEAELAEINEWYHAVRHDPADFHQWLEEEGGDKELSNKLYDNFQNRVSPAKKRIWQVAAIVVLLAGIAILFRTYFLPSGRTPAADHTTAVIKPGQNKAVLTLADGSQIVLDEAENGQIASQQGVKISKTANGQLLYDFSGEQQSGDQLVYNTLYVPRGGQYQVVLPDGTNIWMNSGSRLNFPVTFKGKKREVTLSGEAYFEVRHQKHRPFIIVTGNQAIEVLGTHFNVNGYEDEQQISTTLLQGSVKVSNLATKKERILAPGEQSRFSRSNGEIAVQQVKAEDVIAWKNGYFLFDNQDLPAILRAIGRWYDVEIEFQYTGKYERFGGTFSRSSDLTKILENLQELGDVHFKVIGRKIIVTR